MKFAIPLENGKLTAHFGHCHEFALVEAEGNEIMKKETYCRIGSTAWEPMWSLPAAWGNSPSASLTKEASR